MSLKLARARIQCCGLITCLLCSCLLSSCFHPPYNNFKPVHPMPRRVVTGAVVGTAVGAATTGTVAGALAGTVAGGTAGVMVGFYKASRGSIIKELNKENIQYVQYGDTMTLIVPVDKYFMFQSPRLNEVCYPGLENIIRLLRFYPNSPVYVAGFTDNVGTRRHKKLMSQAQAETMLTFLWANNIPAQLLKAEGYGDKNDVGDNKLIHGSAFNRRIEIQWFNNYGIKTCATCPAPVPSPVVYASK
ncbi:C-OmpA-like family protein CmpA [Legionella parisiensis]|uniref:Putative lipoprotein YiaD n=1 Tax=Legionella parisiensis TaxID=45071 RepID=A0A1E5JTF1_9GAMM|nr:C-OmpA-like family protein CmpA [Legionella parisiensis]KTD40382.1 lipoprotein [Legionella parisiensis]OEH47791.1 putative lipoprotein YiaD [Legionella parisiensis]STX77184.1 lipoprotein [Legionella parisiensis]